MRRPPAKALVASAAALAALIFLGACTGGSQQAGGRHKLDLKIGDLVPLSGIEQPFGATGQKAVNLAAEPRCSTAIKGAQGKGQHRGYWHARRA